MSQPTSAPAFHPAPIPTALQARWSQTEVAPDDTHHRLDGQPLYTARFDEVLKFHAPGLAPVRVGGSAYHIDMRGEPAYSQRFLRTFGFYEGRATVQAADGWHPITPDGEALTPGRYAWCGNFQGGRCPVRDQAGYYHHLTPAGAAAYPQRWRYAGDFRDGIAVVQGEDGRATHIDPAGNPLHPHWFLDLDVFHKGFARARDERGWLHIDRQGKALYSRRFAAVEPFYNGQARVENFDGSLEVIDETGTTQVVLRAALRREFEALSKE